MKINIPHVVSDTDRHGNLRVYYRVKGKPKVRLFKEPGSVEFLEEVEAAKAVVKAAQSNVVAPESLRGVCIAYFDSAAFRLLGENTQTARRGILEDICRSTGKSKIERGTLPFARMQAEHVEALRDEKLDLPSAANGRVKALRQLFKWARKTKKAKSNPAQEVEYLQEGDGWHTWSEDEVRQFQSRWPVGTRARLALDLMLYTGTRRSDAVRLGPPMERERIDAATGTKTIELHFTEHKGARSRVRRRKEGPKFRELPILPVLQATIEATKPIGLQTYLVTELGKPFTGNGFGNKMREWCDAAGLPHCTAHGLRKAGATFASDNGATTMQLMAIYGWDSIKEAERYTRRANRRRLTRQGIHLVGLPGNDAGPKVSHQDGAPVSHREKV